MAFARNLLGSLLLFGFCQQLAAAAPSSTKTTTAPSSTSKTSTVRAPEDVARSRSAQSRTTLDHAANRLSGTGTQRQSTPDLSRSKGSDLSKGDQGAPFEDLLVTDGEDNKNTPTEVLSPTRGGGTARTKQTASTRGLGKVERRGTRQNGPNVAVQANQGIGDGSNVNVSVGSTPDGLKNNVRTFVLHQGTAFVAHNHPVRIKTDRGEVRVAPRSVVYVVSLGKSVAVYDIADHKSTDVTVVTPGNKQMVLKAGEQLVLSDKDNSSFEKANPASEIQSSRVKELGTEAKTRIYKAEFSPTAALDHAHRFQELLSSKSQKDKALVDHILKTAAIVLTLRGSGD